MHNPDLHANQAARLVQAEPLLAARTVAITNSAAYPHADYADHAITNVRTALSTGLHIRRTPGADKKNARSVKGGPNPKLGMS